MDDGYTLTVAGLMRKREALCNEIAGLHDTMEVLIVRLDHLDATIRMFDPNADVDTMPNRPPPRLAAFRGEMSRVVLDIMRKASGPLTTGEIGEAVGEIRKMDPNDRAALVHLTRRVGMALRKMQSKGLVASEPTRKGGMMRWWLV